MLETLKLSKTLKSSLDEFNLLDNLNVSSIKTPNIEKVYDKEGRGGGGEGGWGKLFSYYNPLTENKVRMMLSKLAIQSLDIVNG